MRGLLRKLRGALGLAVVWGVSGAAILAGVAAIIGVFDPNSIDPGESLPRFAAIGGAIGAASGLGFSALLAWAERRKALRNLSLGRVALLGAIGAAAFPLLTTANNALLLVVCPLGAALAAGSVALARRAALEAPVEQPRLP